MQAACPTRLVRSLGCRNPLARVAPELRDEPDNIGGHERSHTAIPIRPISASDTRSSASISNRMRGMIAGVRSFRARTVSLLQGPLAVVTLATPHAGTFARAG